MPATVPLLAQIQEVHIYGLCVTYVFGCIHVIPCILCVTRYDYTLMREVILQTNYFTKFNFTMCIVSKCRQSYNWWLKWFWEKLNLFIFPKLMFNAGDCAITCADTRSTYLRAMCNICFRMHSCHPLYTVCD